MKNDKNSLENLQISELNLINEEIEKNERIVEEKSFSKQSKKAINLTLILILSFLSLLTINFCVDVYQTYQSIASSSQIVAWTYITLYLCALMGVFIYILTTIKNYRKLKNSFDIQTKTANTKNYTQEHEVALMILDHYKNHHNAQIREKSNILYKEVKSNSIHSPYMAIKKELINELDQQASQVVYKSAKEVSLFTAFSPGSALDSIAVVFSSVKLMKQVFYIYGYKTNFFTTLLIFKKILENATLAALIEYSDDSISDVLGDTLLSKLSVKIAQGVGNGVLMLRIGNVVIQGARPFASNGSSSSYKQMTKSFLQSIKKRFKK